MGELAKEIEQQHEKEKSYTGGQGDLRSLLFVTERESPTVNPLVSGYYSEQRDRDLKRLVKNNDILTIAFFNLGTKVLGIKPHIVQEGEDSPVVEALNDKISAIWSKELMPFINDLLSTDNGGFLEIQGGEGTSREDELEPTNIEGTNVRVPAINFRHLSSHRCVRTNDPDFPVVYTSEKDNKRYKLHKSRIFTLIDYDFGDPRLNGVGFCAISRVLQNATQTTATEDLLIDLLYDGLVGEIIIVYPLESDQIKDAYKAAQERRTNKERYMKNVFLGSERAAPVVERIPLRRLPENFDKEQAIQIFMYLLAAAIGFDARELWPTTQSGATKADATIQHVKARQKFIKWWLDQMTIFLETYFLPMGLKVEFDFVDELEQEEQDKSRKTLADTFTLEQSLGIVGRETMLETYLDRGFITQGQYERELLRVPDNTTGTNPNTNQPNLFADTEVDTALANSPQAIQDIVNN